MRLIFYISILAGIGVGLYMYLFIHESCSFLEWVICHFSGLFLILFGVFGFVSRAFVKSANQDEAKEHEIAAHYFLLKYGFWGKYFLFPIKHVKSRNPAVISFFSALIWVIILMIILGSLYKK